MLLIVIMYALFASSFSMGKVLLYYAGPIFLTGARMVASGLILLSYQHFKHHRGIRFEKRHILLFAQFIFFGVYANYILRFWGLKYLPSSKTSFFYNISPFITALYAYWLLNERMTRKQWIGLTIGFIGMIPILLSTTPAEAQMGEFLHISWPEVAVIISVAFTSYSWIVLRKLVRDHNYNPVLVNGVTMTGGGILALITAYFFEHAAAVTNVWEFSKWLIAVIIISNLICHNLYASLTRHYSSTFLSFSGFLMPLFASLYGALWLGEIITWHFYVSAVIVFFGLLLFYKDELDKASENPAQ